MPLPIHALRLVLVILLTANLCSCSSTMHLVQTRSGRGYIARHQPELIDRTGFYRFEDSERIMVLVPEDEVLEIRRIDPDEARRLERSTFLFNGAP